jgi:hypothetical protein
MGIDQEGKGEGKCWIELGDAISGIEGGISVGG